MTVSTLFTIYVATGIAGALLAPLSVATGKLKRETLYYLGLLFLIVELVFSGALLLLGLITQPIFLWGRRIVFDGFSSFAILFLTLMSLFVYLFLFDLYIESSEREGVVSLVFIVLVSSGILAASGSVTLFFTSWVTVSIASYVAVGLRKRKTDSDAAVKYAVLGSISTVFLVLWLASGVILNGDLISSSVNPVMTSSAALVAAIFLLVAGGFKTGVFPFHWWLPDVYSEADGRIVSLITGIVKSGVVVGLARMLLLTTLGKTATPLLVLTSLLAVATMTYGNIAAMTSKGFQRVMAYSSIAHIGYVLVGIVALIFYSQKELLWGVQMSSAAILVHLISYSIAKPIAFTTTSLYDVKPEIGDLKGLWYKKPFVAFSLLFSMLSLLGLPPLLGFWGKLYMFKAAVGYSFPLVIIAILNSGISSYYYGRIIREVFSPGTPKLSEKASPHIDTVLFALSLLLVLLGVGFIQRIYTIMWMYTP